MKKWPQKTIWLRKLTILHHIWALMRPIKCLSDPYRVQKVFTYTKMMVGTWRSTPVIFCLVEKPWTLVKYDPKRLYSWENLPFSTTLPRSPLKDSKRFSIYQNYHWNVAVNSRYLQSDKKNALTLVKERPQKKKIQKKKKSSRFSM